MIDIYSRGTARIRHKTTGVVFEIDADELEWDAIGSDERQMGPETTYMAEIDHPDLGHLTWGLWEYPAGMENMTETEVNGHELLEDIAYGLQHLPDEYDEQFYETSIPLEQRLADLPQELNDIKTALAELRAAQPMFGHNMPPEEYRLGLEDSDIYVAEQSVALVESELAKPNALTAADSVSLNKAQSGFAGLSSKLLQWLKTLPKIVATGIPSGMAVGIGKELWEDPVALYDKVSKILDTLGAWIQFIN